MNCEHTYNLLDDYINSELSEVQLDAISDHHQNCVYCNLNYLETLGIRELLKQLPIPGPSNSVYRFAYHLCQSQSDAEEMVKMVIRQVHPGMNGIEKNSRLKASAARALYVLYSKVFQKATNYSQYREYNDMVFNGNLNKYKPRILNDLHSAVKQLDEDQRIVVLLHDAESYTLSELEDILRMPVSILKPILNHAREAIKKSVR